MSHVSTLHDERHTDAEAWFLRRSPMVSLAPALLTELLHTLGATSGGPAAGVALPAIPLWRVRTGVTLVHEGARAECIHVVRSGSFKCFKTSEDGYEQVLSFAAPGEVLGFEALCSGQHPVSIVALEDATVFALPVRELDGWRQRFPALDHALQLALSRQLARAGEIAEMMAAVAAEVRLARFLVWLSTSMAERGQSPRRLYLRMSRRDIASLLGVAHETVSRSFTTLAEWGYVRVDNREVEILDAAGLHTCTRSTRGLADEAAHGAVATGRHRAAPRLGAVN